MKRIKDSIQFIVGWTVIFSVAYVSAIVFYLMMPVYGFMAMIAFFVVAFGFLLRKISKIRSKVDDIYNRANAM